MAGSLATMLARAANLIPFNMRFFDESGTGAGPYSGVQTVMDPATKALITPASKADIQALANVSAQGSGYAPSGLTPVTGTFTAPGVSAIFHPIAGRKFNVTLTGSWVGTVIMERRFAGDATWYWIDYKTIMQEDEVGVDYRFHALTLDSGSLTYRISG